MVGRIVGLTCGTYSVMVDDIIYRVPARGLFRNNKIKPLVGDIVDLDEINLVINNVHPRKSSLNRPSVANLDQLLIVESLVEPEFSHLLTFKYLTYANMHNITPKIILTKADCVADKNKISEIVNVYKTLGIEIFVVSNKNKEGLEEVKKLFRNKLSCLMGQSGVGKSSLINAIDPHFDRKIGEYSLALGRGKHQTKEVILLPYEGGFIADTPGFSSLDLGLYKEDLATYFPGFTDKYTLCYFSNCLHISEHKCAVKQSLEQQKIPQIAYECYLKLSNEAIFKARRFE